MFLSNFAFLEEVKRRHNSRGTRGFCWVLGSGASSSSGIPLGRELAKEWIEQMYIRSQDATHHRNDPGYDAALENWANKNLIHEIPDFDFSKIASLYPQIYQLRFKVRPEDGYASIEGYMSKARPNTGYKILAQIMSAWDKHNVAVTTNFDNLLETAISLYTGEVPFVCGHESLAEYAIKHSQGRASIMKIHRDLFLNPWSRPHEIEQLADQWVRPLERIFRDYTPIVIGFGDTEGSGGSLMRFLEKLDALQNGLYWCYREKKSGALPANDVQNVVKKHGGSVVPILGFDHLMLQLWEEFQCAPQDNYVQDKFTGFVNEYRDGKPDRTVRGWDDGGSGSPRQLTEIVSKLPIEGASLTKRATIESAKAAISRMSST